jgi:hypothetical protein
MRLDNRLVLLLHNVFNVMLIWIFFHNLYWKIRNDNVENKHCHRYGFHSKLVQYGMDVVLLKTIFTVTVLIST